MRWKLKTSLQNDDVTSVELVSQKNSEYQFRVGDELVTIKDPRRFPFSMRANGQYVSLETWTAQRWRAAFGERIVTVTPLAMGASAEASKNEIRTQMPGRVLKILVSPGQQIEAKQTLLIIEAMKMENEIRSEAAATVEAIEVTQGQSVESGALLIRLKIAA